MSFADSFDLFTRNLLYDVIPFRFVTNSALFERLVLSLIVIRSRLMFKNGMTSVKLMDFLPGCRGPKKLMELKVQIKPLKLGRESVKWITTVKKSQQGTSTQRKSEKGNNDNNVTKMKLTKEEKRDLF